MSKSIAEGLSLGALFESSVDGMGTSRPSAVDAVDLSSLTPVLRILLLHDGTLTTALEALRCAPVTLQVQHEHPIVHSTTATNLFGSAGSEHVVRRLADIRDQRTGLVLVETMADIAFERFPEGFPALLASCRRGLGEAIVRAGLSIRREILWYGRQQDSLLRSHRLLHDGTTLCCIVERILIGRVLSDGALRVHGSSTQPHRG